MAERRKLTDINMLSCRCKQVEKMSIMNKAWGEDCECIIDKTSIKQNIKLIVVDEK